MMPLAGSGGDQEMERWVGSLGTRVRLKSCGGVGTGEGEREERR